MREFNIEQIPKPEGLPLFPKTGLPVDLEIGCGVGLHPIQYAHQNPQRFLVAIEHTQEKFLKFKRRYENHGSPKNLLPIHANAISWVSHCAKEGSLDRCFLLYPNPFPKDKQRNQRWHAMPFMGHLLTCLKDRGTLTLATNKDYYANEARDYFQREWKLQLIEDFILPKGSSPRTHFEKKYLERDEACYNLVFQRPLD